MKNAKQTRLKIYSVIITICFVLLFSAFVVVFHHAGYDTKVLVKLGLKERVVETNWAVVGWNNTLEKMDYDADVVFLGDSITRGSDFREYFPNQKIVNLGYPGDSLEGMITRVSGVAAISPEKVFVLGGINGLTDFNIDNCISTYNSLIDALFEALPNSEIYIQSVLPIASNKEITVCHNTSIMEFNSKLEQLAKEKEATFIDLYSLYELDGEMNPELTKDGIHIFPEAYDRWAIEIAQYMD